MRQYFKIACVALIASSFAQAAESNTPKKPRSPSQITAEAPEAHWRSVNPEDVVKITLPHGDVYVELMRSLTPGHAENMTLLVREKFYDGLEFYRVIEGFVAQGGDMEETRTPKKGKKGIPHETFTKGTGGAVFTPLGFVDGYAPESGFIDGFAAARNEKENEHWAVHCAGAFAMARGASLDSGGTEIFIVLGPALRYLDRNITVFGRVIHGMSHLQKLNRSTAPGGILPPEHRTKIVSATMLSDVEAQDRMSFKVMKTDSTSFAELIQARANRPNAWFVYKPDFVDVCSVGVPVKTS